MFFNLFVLMLLNGCSNSSEKFSPGADFENCETVYIGWDIKKPDKTKELVKVVSQYEHVTLVLEEGKGSVKSTKNFLKNEGVNLNQIDFITLDHKDASIWVRDYAPVFLFDKFGNEKLFSPNTSKEVEMMSDQFFFKRKLKFRDKSIYESVGGAREFNGKGTVILVEQFEILKNFKLSKSQIENIYKWAFNQTNIIWLKQGLPIDKFEKYKVGNDSIEFIGSNGHVDEFCRFINDSTVLLAQVDSTKALSNKLLKRTYNNLEENCKILKSSRLEDGRNINIIRIPIAPLVYGIKNKPDGTKIVRYLVTSYHNFLITDKIIVIPSYDNYNVDNKLFEKSDNLVYQILSGLKPDHKILFCDSYELNMLGGGLHCVSSNRVKRKRS